MQNLKEQWAKNNAQAQNTAPQDKEIVKDTIQKILLNNLQKEITVPKTYTTIQDLFTANEGDRLQTLADWFQSPQFNRFTSGSYTFDPESKSMLSTGERLARKQEAQLQAEQQKAIEAQKQQLDIAKGLNSEYNDLEIADKKLQQDAQQFAQNLAFERERLAEERRHNRAVEATARDKNNEEIYKKQEEINNIYKSIDLLEDAFDELPQNKTRGGLQKATAIGVGFGNAIGARNDETTAFEAIRNPLVTTLARAVAGEKGVLTDRDFARAEKMLPSVYDSPQQARAKISEVKKLIATKNGFSYETPKTTINTNTPKVDKAELEKVMRKRGLL